MVLNFDVELFCENLRATKPPYECPVKTCGKIYKSFAGIQLHVHGHNSVDEDESKALLSVVSNIGVPSVVSNAVKQSRKIQQRTMEQIQDRDTSSTSVFSRIVDVEVGVGRTLKVDVRAPLTVHVRHTDDCGHTTDFRRSPSAKCSPTSSRDAGKFRKEVSPSTPGSRLPEPNFRVIDDFVKCPKVPQLSASYYRFTPKTAEELKKELDYDMDEMDTSWLYLINQKRRKLKLAAVAKETFEQLMDCFEKESFFQPIIEPGHPMPADDDAICCICLDGECHVHNVILFCDLCNLAVHQECYGVPNVPEGPWLCRRCLLSPSRAIPCCLCPSLRGAFKQTDDGRWAHVVCALWIPSVGFANGVFLEPVDGINRIAPARWKLTCFICKRRGVGACIQCHRQNCYTAFHVTCALQVGLHMKVEKIGDTGCGFSPGPNGSQAPNFKKSAFCDVHSLSCFEAQPLDGDEVQSDLKAVARAQLLKKIRTVRQVLGENTPPGPVLSIPVVLPSSISKIMKMVSLQNKKEFIDQLHSYWTLKRDAFNGVSLLSMTATNSVRSQPQANSLTLSTQADTSSDQQTVIETAIRPPFDARQAFRRLRQQMEKVRLLLELVKKRERVKLEQVKQYEALTEMRLQPLSVLLRRALLHIEATESGHLSEIWRKVNSHQYTSVEQFAEDFDLVVASLLEASKFHGSIHKACIHIRDQGTEVIQAVRGFAETIGFDRSCGLHLPFVDGKPPLQQSAPPLVDVAQCNGGGVVVSTNEVRVEEVSVSPASSKLSGVNRRTMILFSKKAKQRRLSAIQLAAVKDSIEEATTPSKTAVEVKVSSIASKVVLPDSQPNKVVKNESHHLPLSANGFLTKPPPAKRKRTCRYGVADVTTDVGERGAGCELSAEGSRAETGTGPINRTAVLDTSKRFKTEKMSGIGVGVLPAATQDTSAARYPIRGLKVSTFEYDTNKPPLSPGLKVSSTDIESEKHFTSGHNILISDNEAKKRPISSGHAFFASDIKAKKQTITSGHEVPASEIKAKKQPITSGHEVHASEIKAKKQPITSGHEVPVSEIKAMKQPITSGHEVCASEIKAKRSPTSSLDIVWAKSRGFPSYPAMVVSDPRRPGGLVDGVDVPQPPSDFLSMLDDHVDSDMLLVMFFDVKHTWQWLHRSALQPLGASTAIDSVKLSAPTKLSMRKAVRMAYNRAIIRRSATSLK